MNNFFSKREYSIASAIFITFIILVLRFTPVGEAYAPSEFTPNKAYVKEVFVTPTPPAHKPSEKEVIVAYITRLWEKHGTDQVVRAINCFYSESGLRTEAVSQNSDAPKSKDWNVAQLNDYWHNLTPEQKYDLYAGLDKAYEIYKGRGNNFSAWYGKLCQ